MLRFPGGNFDVPTLIAQIDDGPIADRLADNRRNLRLTQAKGFARFATEKAARRREVRKAIARGKGKPVTLASKA